jgi:hypothetical protein
MEPKPEPTKMTKNEVSDLNSLMSKVVVAQLKEQAATDARIAAGNALESWLWDHTKQ